jgi:hypothetical protein
VQSFAQLLKISLHPKASLKGAIQQPGRRARLHGKKKGRSEERPVQD